MRCATCGKGLVGSVFDPPCGRGWCSPACAEAWDKAYPEEGWVRVEDATLEQRAELLAILGKGEAC